MTENERDEDRRPPSGDPPETRDEGSPGAGSRNWLEGGDPDERERRRAAERARTVVEEDASDEE